MVRMTKSKFSINTYCRYIILSGVANVFQKYIKTIFKYRYSTSLYLLNSQKHEVIQNHMVFCESVIIIIVKIITNVNKST